MKDHSYPTPDACSITITGTLHMFLLQGVPFPTILNSLMYHYGKLN